MYACHNQLSVKVLKRSIFTSLYLTFVKIAHNCVHSSGCYGDKSIMLTILTVSSWLVTLTTGMSMPFSQRGSLTCLFVFTLFLVRMIGAAKRRSSKSFTKSAWCLINDVRLLSCDGFRPDIVQSAFTVYNSIFYNLIKQISDTENSTSYLELHHGYWGFIFRVMKIFVFSGKEPLDLLRIWKML